MKNIFELAEEEKEIKSNVRENLKSLFSRDDTRAFIANQLYRATYSDRWRLREFTTGEGAPLQEIIDEFCGIIFGASYEDVLKAWDKYLG